MRIYFVIDLIIFYSKSTHSKAVALSCQILTLVRLIVTTFCQITWNVSKWVQWRLYDFISISTGFIYVL